MEKPDQEFGIVDYTKIIFVQLWSTVYNVSVAFIPSFIRRPIGSPDSTNSLRPTAYLDGLRGTAALSVFIYHFSYEWYPFIVIGWGSSASDRYFLQLPVIRLLYSGSAGVSIFFVISGYVLSHKAITLIHQGKMSALLDTVASSVFRRYFRLYIPTVFGTLIHMLIMYFGFYPPGALEEPLSFDTFRKWVEDWTTGQVQLMNPFEPLLFWPRYNTHLWTIPIEFRGSIVVFVTVIGLSRVKSTWRLALLMTFAVYLFYMSVWDVSLFLFGTLLSDMDCLRLSSASSQTQESPSHSYNLTVSTFLSSNKTLRVLLQHLQRISQSSRWRVCIRALPYILFVSSLYFLSYNSPDNGPSTAWGYGYLSAYTPMRYDNVWLGYVRVWTGLGAVLLVSSLSLSSSTQSSQPLPQVQSSMLPASPSAKSRWRDLTLPSLRSPFESRFAQYLGRISYALYIVHGPIIYSIGARFLIPAFDVFSGQTPLSSSLVVAGENVYTGEGDWTRYNLRFVVAAVAMTSICFWAADVFCRLIDELVVQWGKWIEDKVSHSSF